MALRLVARRGRPRDGIVALVGAGPGDADLLTLRAATLIREADVIVHDRLVAREILAMARPAARLVDVGKRRAHHRCSQDEINDLLVRLAREGLRVVRLKGGDPLIFGRGGEEAASLARAGVHYELVPGVTAASACAAGARIPLTHRGVASGCVFITGHTRDGAPDADWPLLARTRQTLVVYMGLHTLPEIALQLLSNGRGGNTPVALVERGGTRRQRVVTGTLASIAARARVARIASPALVIIGEVVDLRAALDPGVAVAPAAQALLATRGLAARAA